MTLKVDGGAPSIPTPIDTADTAGPVEKASDQAQPAPTTSTSPETPSRPTPTYNSGAFRAEHFLAGQMRSLQLKTGAGGPGQGTQPTGSTPARTLSEGSSGADVQEAKGQINQWRADHGKTPIRNDDKFDGQTTAAVKDFQKQNGLEPNGIIGPGTRNRLDLENDASFKALNPDTKTKIREQMNAYSKDPVASDNLRQLATDPNFAKLPPELQQHALKKLASQPQDAANLANIRENARDRVALEGNGKFQALDDVNKKAIRERMDKYEDKPVERSLLMKLATDENLGKLGRANQHRALEALSANPKSEANLASLQKMTGSRLGFQKMDDGQKGTVLDLAIKNAGNEKYVGDLSTLVSDPKFGAMNPVDKGKTLNVFTETTPRGRAALQDLLQREIHGVPALTTHGLHSGSPTLLDQLDRLSSTPLDSRMKFRSGNPVSHSQVTEQLLQVVSDPDNAMMQARGTCTPTTVTHGLAKWKPAEYARLAVDLATTGSSKLANGDTITVPGESAWLPAHEADDRTDPERLIQSSLMDYARPGKGYVNYNNGTDGAFGTPDDGFVDPAHPNAPRNLDGWPDRPHSGLKSDEGSRVMAGIYNKPFQFFSGSEYYKDDGKQDILNKINGALGHGASLINVGIHMGNIGHTVEVYKVDHGRVYFRNPWGPGNVGRTGTIHGTPSNNTDSGPLRRVENGNKAEESMTIEDFKEAVTGAYVNN